MIPIHQDASGDFTDVSRQVGRMAQGCITLPGPGQAPRCVARITGTHGQVDLTPFIAGCTTRHLRRAGRDRLPHPDRSLPKHTVWAKVRVQLTLNQNTPGPFVKLPDDLSRQFSDRSEGPRVHPIEFGEGWGGVTCNRATGIRP